MLALADSKLVRALSAEGGEYEVMPDARKFLCFTNDGILYLSQSHESSPWVLAFKEKLRRAEVPFTVKLVNIEELDLLYQNSVSVDEKKTQSIRQREILELIKAAVSKNASDIHLIVSAKMTQVKMRVDGALSLLVELSSRDGLDICATIYQTMCDVAEPVFNPRRSQDARIMVSALRNCQLYGGRVATRPTDSGLLMVIRLLYDRSGQQSTTLESLGYLSVQTELIARMASRRFGINILSGPTGSGKSTTLECVLKKLIEKRLGTAHVLTIEDPPEYRIDGAVQTPILCDKDDDEAVSHEWASAISNAMRLDPDILMCGEVRDLASATATFRAAMTGHGVWTTVHANDAVSILSRLQDIGVSPAILSDAFLMTGLVNQVLVPKICEQCKESYTKSAQIIEADQRTRIEKYCEPEQVYLRGSGCEACQGTGGQGRTVVAEVLEPTVEFMDRYLRQGKNAAQQYWLQDLRGLTKQRVMVMKVNLGILDPREGERSVCMLDDGEIR